MTPITRERLVRLSLKAILEGPPAERLEEVLKDFATLSASDQRALLRLLRPRLQRALRQKTAVIRFGAQLPAEIDSRLEAHARSHGMFFVERAPAPEALAGFSLSLGDERTDLTLLGRLKAFLQT